MANGRVSPGSAGQELRPISLWMVHPNRQIKRNWRAQVENHQFINNQRWWTIIQALSHAPAVQGIIDQIAHPEWTNCFKF